MGVGLYPSRHHNLTSGVDYPSYLIGQGARRRHGHNLLSLHGHVPLADPHGSHHLPTAND